MNGEMHLIFDELKKLNNSIKEINEKIDNLDFSEDFNEDVDSVEFDIEDFEGFHNFSEFEIGQWVLDTTRGIYGKVQEIKGLEFLVQNRWIPLEYLLNLPEPVNSVLETIFNEEMPSER